MSGHRNIVRSEGGFTLIEVLMVVAVLGIIVGPLTNAMIVGLRTSGRTAAVLVTSADRQMLTTYLPPDALSATAGTVDNLATGGCLNPTGTRLLLLTWSEFTGAAAPPNDVDHYAADYRLVPVNGRTTLVRDVCVVGSNPAEVTVAHAVTAAAASGAVSSPSPSALTGTVAVTVTDSLGAQYTVSGTRRTA